MEDPQSIRARFEKDQEYSRLNEILVEKQKISSRLQALRQEIASESQKFMILDREFDTLVIKVQPTVEAKSPTMRKKADSSELDSLLAAVKKNPKLIARLQDFVEFGDK